MTLTKKAAWTGLIAAIVVGLFLLTLHSPPASKPISIIFVGTTNGTIGLTNGVWDIYVVTNHTTNAFAFAGAQILLKTNQEWVLDPSLQPTDNGGWVVPPTRMWREEAGSNKWVALPGRSSFRVFFAQRDSAIEWKASLRFVDYQPPMSRPTSAVSRTVWEVRDTMERTLRKPIDCPLPEKVSAADQ